jgi:hypothetical protein
MHTSIRGPNDKLSKKEIREIIKLFASLLLTKRLAKYIFVEVQFLDMSGNSWGFCTPTDFDYNNHREFEILINRNLTKTNQIRTIAHEMVHLRQYAVGDLKQYKNEKYKWLGRKMIMTEEDYDIMPWEIQAHLAENIMLAQYRKYCRKAKNRR